MPMSSIATDNELLNQVETAAELGISVGTFTTKIQDFGNAGLKATIYPGMKPKWQRGDVNRFKASCKGVAK
jgi:hypothetical protein